MQKAGTPEEEAAFAFALPIVGRKDWSDVVATKFDPPRNVKRETGHVVFDFVAQRANAQQENVQSVEMRRIGPPDEVPEDALQQHPKPKGRALLTYRVAIPATDAKRCLLTFDALLNNANPSVCSKCQRSGIIGTLNKSNRCGDSSWNSHGMQTPHHLTARNRRCHSRD